MRAVGCKVANLRKAKSNGRRNRVQQEVFGCFSLWKISKIYLVRLGNGF